LDLSQAEPLPTTEFDTGSVAVELPNPAVGGPPVTRCDVLSSTVSHFLPRISVVIVREIHQEAVIAEASCESSEVVANTPPTGEAEANVELDQSPISGNASDRGDAPSTLSSGVAASEPATSRGALTNAAEDGTCCLVSN